MTNTGLPLEDVDAVRDAITDMWTDAPGGWVYEWSKLTASYAEADSHQQAALAYGWAKFPTLADEPKRVAHAMQLEQYLLAAPGFGLDFRREVLDLPYRDATTKVPVHLFAPLDLADDTPVVLISGGVDSWMMDAHIGCVVLATQLRVRVLAFDIAGTGESSVPMTGAGGGEIVRGLITHARTLGDGVVAHVSSSVARLKPPSPVRAPVSTACTESSATRWDSTHRPARRSDLRGWPNSRCGRCSIRTTTRRCW